MSDNQIVKNSRTDFAVPVITYHSIDDSGSVVSTSPEIFRQQIANLNDAGYRTLTLHDLAETVRTNDAPQENGIVLTFDDGFENFQTVAYPILEAVGFTATVFLVSDKCGRRNDWIGNPPDLPNSRLLSWGQVRELAACGIEFGSHTATHRDLTAIDEDAVLSELVRSKEAIGEATGKEATSFAYPFGRMNAVTKRLVADHYSSACSTNLGKVTGTSDIFALERIDAYYLSDPASMLKLNTHRMGAYLAVRQVLRSAKAAFASA